MYCGTAVSIFVSHVLYLDRKSFYVYCCYYRVAFSAHLDSRKCGKSLLILEEIFEFDLYNFFYVFVTLSVL